MYLVFLWGVEREHVDAARDAVNPVLRRSQHMGAGHQPPAVNASAARLT
jgi:hypothetical protein